ncbi:MAG: DegT/DnrJ/EryC1/StrS family aminotransferase, partial [Anaerolineae bacterium]
WGPEEEQGLIEVLNSGVWGIGSAKIEEFERRFAAMQDAKYAVSVPNGTIAIEIALRGAGVTYGDEVIVPPYTFVATASAVLTVGAIPVFADIQPDTYQIDPVQVERLISPRTKAIIPVHIGGGPADLDAIKDVARCHNLLVIEDCAQAHLAAWRGTRVGAIGDCGTFSFQSSKNITSGEGGAIVGNDERLMESVWSYHNVGRVREGAWYQHEVLGGNARMAPWQAAILLAQMSRAEVQLAIREKNAAYLSSLLADIPGVEPVRRDERVTHHAYHLYIFRYSAGAFGGKSRADFLKALSAEGIPCTAGYVPLYRENAIINASGAIARLVGAEPVSVEANAERCSVAERVCKEESCWLFQSMFLGSEADMDSIAEAIAKIQKAWG